MADAAEQVYEDRWGAIIVRPGLVEIRWYDTTAAMQWVDFQAFLARFADVVEQCRAPGVLVEATAFRMDMSLMRDDWRDEHIIPRYNAAGVRKFAFHMPAGMPAIGAPPAKEGPAEFATAYFGTRTEAMDWLAA
jgi:hypothetical protein